MSTRQGKFPKVPSTDGRFKEKYIKFRQPHKLAVTLSC